MIPFVRILKYGNTEKRTGFKGNYVSTTYSAMSTRAEMGFCTTSTGDIYAMGGVNGSTYYRDFWKYSSSTDTWSSLTAFPPSTRGGAAMAYDPINNAVYSFGGSTGVPALSNKRNDLYRYDVSSNAWALVSPSGTIPGARVHGAMSYYNAKLYLFGSYYTEAVALTAAVYDISTNTWTALSSAPYAMAYGSNTVMVGSDMIAVGVSGSTYYLMRYSTENDTWSIVSTTTNPIGRIAYYRGIIVAFGFNNGTMYTSDLSSSWENMGTISTYLVDCNIFSNIGDNFILTLGGKNSTAGTTTAAYKLT